MIAEYKGRIVKKESSTSFLVEFLCNEYRFVSITEAFDFIDEIEREM